MADPRNILNVSGNMQGKEQSSHIDGDHRMWYLAIMASSTCLLFSLQSVQVQRQRRAGHASIGTVEALKDQGFCRWNCAMRLLQKHGKSNVRSYSQAERLSTPSSTAISSKIMREKKVKQSEESLRNVMYLSCWGPNS
ncbi:unnamed protein product [Ilex paraguariensis]|uniref:Uncharacterized protein n=1 Tax=Ilex paraguariensis TaxID=185542 RepID=A0ABC8UPT6_9AQUA